MVSGEPAFRARFDGQAPPQNRLYWRGLVLWGYDGRRWARAAAGAMPEARPRLAEASSQIGYEVVLEQTNQRWLYALDMPLAAPGTATLDGYFQITAAQRATKATRYRVVSATAYNTGPLDIDQEAAGLQLPGNVTPRMRDLVARWGAGPEKRIYAVTSEGQTTLQIGSPRRRRRSIERDEFFLKLMLALISGTADPYRLINTQRTLPVPRTSCDHESAHARGPRSELAKVLLLEKAAMHLEADLRWLDMTEARLDEIKRQPLPEPEARPRGRPGNAG